MQGLMSSYPLTLTHVFDRAERIFPEKGVATVQGGEVVRETYGDWAKRTRREIRGALLATPPDFETPMPEGYPTIAALRDAGWLPVPRQRLPFRSLVAASSNDPLGRLERV